MDWLRAQMDMSGELGLWIAGSLALALTATRLSWLIARGPLRSRAITAIREWPSTPAVCWLLVSLFLLLPPLAAWQASAASLYYMGLSEIDWLGTLGTGGPLAAAITGISVVGWLAYRRTLPPGTPVRTPRWLAPLDAALWQWHWTFYRSAVIGWLASGVANTYPLGHSSSGSLRLQEALGAAWAQAPMGMLPLAEIADALSSLSRFLFAQPIYWGSWLSLGLVALEWILNPFARADLRVPGRRESAVLAVMLAIATTALFALTRNFWLCLACHVAVETTIAGLRPTPAE